MQKKKKRKCFCFSCITSTFQSYYIKSWNIMGHLPEFHTLESNQIYYPGWMNSLDFSFFLQTSIRCVFGSTMHYSAWKKYVWEVLMFIKMQKQVRIQTNKSAIHPLIVTFFYLSFFFFYKKKFVRWPVESNLISYGWWLVEFVHTDRKKQQH